MTVPLLLLELDYIISSCEGLKKLFTLKITAAQWESGFCRY